MANAWALATLHAMHEAAFGTDPDATGANYKHLKALPDMSFQPTMEVVERPGLVGDLVTQDHVLGPQGGKLSFKLELKASGTAAASGVAAIASEASAIMEAAWGTVVRGTGALLTVGSTTTSIVLAAAGGLGFAKGMAVEINGEVRVITNVAGDTLTLHKALSGAPLTGVTCYASSLFKRANSGHKSVAFVAKRDSGIEYTFLACKVKAKIEGVDAKGTALLACEADVGSYSRTTKASLPATDLTGITAVKAPVVKGASLDWNGTTLLAAGAEFDPGISLSFIETVSDAQNKAGIKATAADPKGNVRAYYLAQNMIDFETATPVPVVISAGSRTTGWLICVVRAQPLAPAFQNRSGLVGEDLPFAARDNGTDAEWTVCVF